MCEGRIASCSGHRLQKTFQLTREGYGGGDGRCSFVVVVLVVLVMTVVVLVVGSVVVASVLFEDLHERGG